MERGCAGERADLDGKLALLAGVAFLLGGDVMGAQLPVCGWGKNQVREGRSFIGDSKAILGYVLATPSPSSGKRKKYKTRFSSRIPPASPSRSLAAALSSNQSSQQRTQGRGEGRGAKLQTFTFISVHNAARPNVSPGAIPRRHGDFRCRLARRCWYYRYLCGECR